MSNGSVSYLTSAEKRRLQTSGGSGLRPESVIPTATASSYVGSPIYAGGGATATGYVGSDFRGGVVGSGGYGAGSPVSGAQTVSQQQAAARARQQQVIQQQQVVKQEASSYATEVKSLEAEAARLEGQQAKVAAKDAELINLNQKLAKYGATVSPDGTVRYLSPTLETGSRYQAQTLEQSRLVDKARNIVAERARIAESYNRQYQLANLSGRAQALAGTRQQILERASGVGIERELSLPETVRYEGGQVVVYKQAEPTKPVVGKDKMGMAYFAVAPKPKSSFGTIEPGQRYSMETGPAFTPSSIDEPMLYERTRLSPERKAYVIQKHAELTAATAMGIGLPVGGALAYSAGGLASLGIYGTGLAGSYAGAELLPPAVEPLQRSLPLSQRLSEEEIQSSKPWLSIIGAVGGGAVGTAAGEKAVAAIVGKPSVYSATKYKPLGDESFGTFETKGVVKTRVSKTPFESTGAYFTGTEDDIARALGTKGGGKAPRAKLDYTDDMVKLLGGKGEPTFMAGEIGYKPPGKVIFEAGKAMPGKTLPSTTTRLLGKTTMKGKTASVDLFQVLSYVPDEQAGTMFGIRGGGKRTPWPKEELKKLATEDFLGISQKGAPARTAPYPEVWESSGFAADWFAYRESFGAVPATKAFPLVEGSVKIKFPKGGGMGTITPPLVETGKNVLTASFARGAEPEFSLAKVFGGKQTLTAGQTGAGTRFYDISKIVGKTPVDETAFAFTGERITGGSPLLGYTRTDLASQMAGSIERAAMARDPFAQAIPKSTGLFFGKTVPVAAAEAGAAVDLTGFLQPVKAKTGTLTAMFAEQPTAKATGLSKDLGLTTRQQGFGITGRGRTQTIQITKEPTAKPTPMLKTKQPTTLSQAVGIKATPVTKRAPVVLTGLGSKQAESLLFQTKIKQDKLQGFGRTAKSLQGLFQGTGFGARIGTGFGTSTASKAATRSLQSMAQGFSVSQAASARAKQAEKTAAKNMQKMFSMTTTPVIPRAPYVPFGFPTLPKYGKKGGEDFFGFKVLVREKGKKVQGKWVPGKFTPLTSFVLPRTQALALGQKAVMGKAARTFKIEPAFGKPGRIKTMPFRPEMFTTRGRTFTEKTKYAIDMPGELEEITFKGLAARQNRASSLFGFQPVKKRKKKKPKGRKR